MERHSKDCTCHYLKKVRLGYGRSGHSIHVSWYGYLSVCIRLFAFAIISVCLSPPLCLSLSVSGTPPQGMHIPLLYVSPFGMRSVRLLTPCQRVWLDISLCVSDCLCAGRIPQGLYVLFFNCSFLCSQSGREVCVCLPFCLSVCCNDTLVL